MKNKGRSAKELETRCTELEKQVQYYKSIAEEAGRNRLREIEQLNRQITDRKKTEEKLRESDKKIRSWLEYSPVCTKVLDRHFHMQYMSSAGINCLQIKDITKFYGRSAILIIVTEKQTLIFGIPLIAGRLGRIL